MQKTSEINKQIAECVGLWLAEGDRKTQYEINLSNNCFEIIQLFNETIRNLFFENKFNVRLYVYTPDVKNVNIPIENCTVRRYIDKRATKPYFIWRLASVELNRKWRQIAKETAGNKQWFADVLRGFFAGEGNIKVGTHNSRAVRIAQKQRISFLEKILDYFRVNYTFRKEDRSYYISHKSNWDKLAELKIADLHPARKLKFWEAYGSFKEEHYRNNFLRKRILQTLKKPCTNAHLAGVFKRTKARIYDVLSALKKENKIQNFRVGSRDCWIRKDQQTVVISSVKQKYLKAMATSKSTREIAAKFGVCWKSAFRRLKELQKLGLATRLNNKRWKRKLNNKKVVKTWH